MRKMQEQSPHSKTIQQHEPIETDVRAVWRTGAVLAGVVIGAFVFLLGLMKWFVETRSPLSAAQTQQAAQDLTQPEQLKQLRSQELRLLEHYGWVDRANGIARIPIERARQIVIEGGLPTFLSAPTTSSSPQEAGESGGAQRTEVEGDQL
jgi:hypothetical protein